MKKKLFFVCCMLLLWSVAVQAEPYIYSSDQATLVFFDCEDFDDVIPITLDGVFDAWMKVDDSVISGTVCITRYRSQPESMLSADALVAIKREEKILLLGAGYRDGVWRSAVETDQFFAPGQRFDVTCLPAHGYSGGFTGASPALVCGGEEFIVSVRADASVFLERYCVSCPDGSKLSIRAGGGSLHASRMLDGIEQESGSAIGIFGGRLRSWTYDAFPKSCAQVKEMEGMGMPEFAEGEAFIFGVNLRERPTGQSPSLGKYTAIVRVLDRAEGTHAPWYQVQWEDKTGWVSGDYVLWPQHEPHRSQIALHLSEKMDEENP